MKTEAFLRKHKAREELATWALSISKEMSDVWDAMIKEGKHEWLMWVSTRPGVFSDATLRKLACRFVRETTLDDGRTVWDLLTDERSREAVEIASAYADGKATGDELKAARDAAANAADAAARAAYVSYAADAAARAAEAADAAAYAADAAARAADAAAAARAAAFGSAYASAGAAQIRMIAQLGNPFREEMVK